MVSGEEHKKANEAVNSGKVTIQDAEDLSLVKHHFTQLRRMCLLFSCLCFSSVDCQEKASNIGRQVNKRSRVQ